MRIQLQLHTNTTEWTPQNENNKYGQSCEWYPIISLYNSVLSLVCMCVCGRERIHLCSSNAYPARTTQLSQVDVCWISHTNKSELYSHIATDTATHTQHTTDRERKGDRARARANQRTSDVGIHSSLMIYMVGRLNSMYRSYVPVHVCVLMCVCDCTQKQMCATIDRKYCIKSSCSDIHAKYWYTCLRLYRIVFEECTVETFHLASDYAWICIFVVLKCQMLLIYFTK